jgi:hypothetical protein
MLRASLTRPLQLSASSGVGPGREKADDMELLFSPEPIMLTCQTWEICKQAFAINSDYGESTEQLATVLIVMVNRLKKCASTEFCALERYCKRNNGERDHSKILMSSYYSEIIV